MTSPRRRANQQQYRDDDRRQEVAEVRAEEHPAQISTARGEYIDDGSRRGDQGQDPIKPGRATQETENDAEHGSPEDDRPDDSERRVQPGQEDVSDDPAVPDEIGDGRRAPDSRSRQGSKVHRGQRVAEGDEISHEPESPAREHAEDPREPRTG